MAAPSYRIRFSADPVQLFLFRAGVERWLRELEWPEAERIDAVLAVSEACANAVQHAYTDGEPGDVEVTGRLVAAADGRRVRWTVRDHGRWRDAAAGRGFGLPTVEACMESVEVRPGEGGTVVRLTSRPVPDAAAAPAAPVLRIVRDA